MNEELTILGTHYNLSRLNRRARIIVNIGKYPQQIGRHEHHPVNEDHLHRLKSFFVYRGTAEKALSISHDTDPALKGIGIIFPIHNKISLSQLTQLSDRGWIVLNETALYVVYSNHTGISVKDENCNARYTAGMYNIEPSCPMLEDPPEVIDLVDVVTDEDSE